MTKPSKTTSRGADIWLRTIAILAVILIHVLSSIQPSPFYSSTGVWQWVVVGLDQAARISVPLFVALSGYGLWQKYGSQLCLQDSPGFLYRRIRKLVPPYVLWSGIFALVFLIIPNWTTPETQPTFFWQLVWGRADYHLYFVPMIVQLYLLFPIFAYLQKRWPVWLGPSALAVQLCWYAYFSYGGHVPLDLVFFRGDSEQYLWSPNWIWYFVLGIQLSAVGTWLQRNRVIVYGLAAGVVSLFTWLVVSAIAAINRGVDPLIVLRFTRYEVVLFASLAIVVLFAALKNVKSVPKIVQQISDWSYHLYLSHTLVLRVIFNILLR